MTIIAYRTVKFESLFKKEIVTNHEVFAVVTFSKISSFAYINSIEIQHLYFHQDNLSFVCLQFYQHNCLKILADNTSYRIQVKNQ